MNNVLKVSGDEAQRVAEDHWTLVREGEGELPAGPLILPLSRWRHLQGGEQRMNLHGVWLGPDDDVESLELWLGVIPLIALDFPSFRDGRGYSQAYLLRSRLGWRGELRAIGDVLRDQLSHMRQCGFTSFAIREDKSAVDALKGLTGMSVQYGRSAIEPRPLFLRR